MKNIIETVKNKYYTYQPGEFMPIYVDGQLANRREFHSYRVRWILKHREAAFHEFTHYGA